MLTQSERDALRQRYTAPQVPPCRVCGEPLKVNYTAPDATGWVCSSRLAEFYPGMELETPEWRPVYDHWRDSKYTQGMTPDPDVLRLLDDYEAMIPKESEVRDA